MKTSRHFSFVCKVYLQFLNRYVSVNAKPNFNFLVDDIAALLMSRNGVRQVIKRQKPSASVPVSEAMLAELVAQCDLVIAGSGD